MRTSDCAAPLPPPRHWQRRPLHGYGARSIAANCGGCQHDLQRGEFSSWKTCTRAGEPIPGLFSRMTAKKHSFAGPRPRQSGLSQNQKAGARKFALPTRSARYSEVLRYFCMLVFRLLVVGALFLCVTQAAPAQGDRPAPARESPGTLSTPAAPLPAEPRISFNSVHVEGPYIAMTFDDGPNAILTPRLLDLLAAHKMKVTFFVVGENAAE